MTASNPPNWTQPASPLLISLFDDDESRWQAVQTRNDNADGFFVYGVRSTKIYCRPTCKARLARRANVSFHDTAEQAAAAGFRACKRCKPEMRGFMPEEAAVRKIRAFVETQRQQQQIVGEGDATADRLMSLSQMAKQTGLSKWHFHRVFKKCVGVTPVEFVRMQRNGSGFDVTITETATTTTGSSSSATGLSPQVGDMSFTWDMMQPFDFESLDLSMVATGDNQILTSAGEDTVLPPTLDPTLDKGNSALDLSWADLLAYPEEPLAGTTREGESRADLRPDEPVD